MRENTHHKGLQVDSRTSISSPRWRPLMPGSRFVRRKHFGIYSQSEFRSLILYEKSRADRHGDTLSLVVIHTGAKKRRSLKELAHALVERLRMSDHIGWMDRQRIGILLPKTTRLQAHRLTDLLRGPAVFKSVGFRIFTFPDTWFEPSSENDTTTKKSSEGPHESRTGGHLFAYDIPLWKRTIDVCGAVVLIAITSPILLTTALYIKLVSRGPILFRQERVGLARRTFQILKLRTMHHQMAESIHADHARSFISRGGQMVKLDQVDPRIIPGGRLIRTLCVDELPQLFNVLLGHMSLVGPRPCIPYEADEYLRWHAGRFSALPGITGLWQISGKNRLSFEEMVRLDIRYMRRLSPWRDTLILLRTPLAIVGFAVDAMRDRHRHKSEIRTQVDGGRRARRARRKRDRLDSRSRTKEQRRQRAYG